MSKLAGRSVLVVDDVASLREAVAYEFELIGCLIYQASSGREAISILETQTIDFVLSDIRMPDGDGMELLTEIRRRHPSTPLVAMVTGFTELSVEHIMNAGAISVFTKPLTMNRIIATFEDALTPKSAGI